MQTAGIEQFNNLDFAFIELRSRYKELDKDLQKGYDSLIRSSKKALTSSKRLEREITLIFPKLFALRLEALSWIVNEGIKIERVLDEVYPHIEAFGKDAKLRKLGLNISNALVYNRKMVEMLKKAGAFSEDSLTEITEKTDLDYTTFMLALQLAPPGVRRLITSLTQASLYIDFFSITGVLIHEGKIAVSDYKLNELTELSSSVVIEYIGNANWFIDAGKRDLLERDKMEWTSLAMHNLSTAYGEQEPDYDFSMLKEPNPDYKI